MIVNSLVGNSFIYFGIAVVVVSIVIYGLVHFNTRGNS